MRNEDCVVILDQIVYAFANSAVWILFTVCWFRSFCKKKSPQPFLNLLLLLKWRMATNWLHAPKCTVRIRSVQSILYPIETIRNKQLVYMQNILNYHFDKLHFIEKDDALPVNEHSKWVLFSCPGIGGFVVVFTIVSHKFVKYFMVEFPYSVNKNQLVGESVEIVAPIA